jgi:hypothetical protein
VEIRVVKWRATASVATALEKLSVHVDDVSRSLRIMRRLVRRDYDNLDTGHRLCGLPAARTR